MNGSDGSCCLCLNSNPIAICDDELYQKVAKYLDIDIPKTFGVPSFVCEICIQSVEEYHEFYERVRSIYQNRFTESETETDPKTEEPILLEESQIINDVKLPKKYLSESKPKYKSKKSYKLRKVRKELEDFFTTVPCPLCGDGVLYCGINVLKKHFKDNHIEPPILSCCNKTFSLNDCYALRKHVKTHTQPDSCKCDICGKVLSTPRHMRLHKELHIPYSERTLECNVCGRKVSGKAEMYRHMKTIHAPQDTVCDICGKEFRRFVTFSVHMRTAHRENKRYVCEICAKTYKAATSLKQHKLTAHSGSYIAPSKECHICGKRVSATYLEKHVIRRHSNDRVHECPLCDKKFKLPADVRSHLVSHSEERLHTCAVCNNSFKTKPALKVHMEQHTEKKTVNCKYCGKLISSYANYLAHKRRMHAKEEVIENVDSNAMKSLTTEDVLREEVVEVVAEEDLVTTNEDGVLYVDGSKIILSVVDGTDNPAEVDTVC